MKKAISMILALLMVFSLAVCASAAEKTDEDKIDWPEKPIEIILPYSAGGDSDAYLRALTPALSDILGVDVVVTNMGGETVAAISEYLKRDADGYTLFYYNSSMHANIASGKVGESNPLTEMVPLGAIVSDNNAGLFVRADSGITNLDEFLEAAASEDFKFATGTKNSEYYLSEVMREQSGVEFSYVAQANSVSDRILQLLSGEIDSMFGTYGALKDYIESGEVVCVGLLAEERSEQLPDIPTLAEQGIEVYNPKRFVLRVKSGTDEAVVDILADAIQRAVDSGCLDETCENYLSTVNYMSPEEQGEWEEECVADMESAFKEE